MENKLVSKTQPIIEEKICEKNDETDILIFDKDKHIGTMRPYYNMNRRPGDIMEVLKVNLNGKDISVLHFLDMDYGMLIPRNIAYRLSEGILKEHQDAIAMSKELRDAFKEKEE